MSNMDSVAFENSSVFQEYNKKLSEFDKNKSLYDQANQTLDDLKILSAFEDLENLVKSNQELKAKISELQVQLQDPEISKTFHPKFAAAIMMLDLEKA